MNYFGIILLADNVLFQILGCVIKHPVQLKDHNTTKRCLHYLEAYILNCNGLGV